MSLLDDVSIVVTPNGYKAGELYAVVPVPSEGAEILSQPVDLQTDFVNNGGGVIVDADTFTTAGGTFDGIRKNNFLTAGTRYKLIIEGNTTSSGFTIGETTMSGNEYGSGFGTHYFTAIGTGSIWLRQSTAGTTDITSFSIKEYTSADMDVTRATAATRVDEDGLVNYAEVIGSELVTCGDFSCATPSTYWTATNAVISFDNNQLTVDDTAGAGGDSRGSQTITTENGKAYRLTFDRISTTSLFYLGVGSGAGYNNIFYSSLGTDTGEYTLDFTATSSSTTIAFISGGNGITVFSNISVKEVTRDNVPRIDYTGGGCPHILAEPQRTNLINYSEDFSQSYWTKSGVTQVTSNQATSPDGTENADLIVSDGTTGVFKGGIFVTGVVTRSVYLKSVTGTVNVILKDPNLTVTQKTLTVTEEWQRFELIESNGTSAQGIWLDDIPASGIYIWGAQLEAGSYATSYIPTSGSTVTRNQDIFTRDGIGSLINSTEGVLFAEIAALSDDLTFRTISLSDNTSSNRCVLRYGGTTNYINVLISSGGSTVFDNNYTLSEITDFNKIAVKWKVNDFALWVDGFERATAAVGSAPIGLSQLQLSNYDNSGNDFYGKVRQLQVYNTALTDTQLAALTS